MKVIHEEFIFFLCILEIQNFCSDEVFVNKDNGSQGGTHWTCFIVKDNKPFYFVSIGGQLDKFLQKQSTKPIIYHNYKKQDIYSKLCGSYSIYFFYFMERMNYYNAILKMCFYY